MLRPDLLNREVWKAIESKAQAAGDEMFTPRPAPASDPLHRMEQSLAAGCLLCHQRDSDKPADGIPNLKPARIRDRWPADATQFHSERLRGLEYQTDARRWFPLAKFGHDSHRLLNCTVCHDARKNEDSSVLLMPKIGVCRECHNQKPDAARTDCLECHHYHDRSHEGRGLQGTFDLEKVLGGGKKKE